MRNRTVDIKCTRHNAYVRVDLEVSKFIHNSNGATCDSAEFVRIETVRLDRREAKDAFLAEEQLCRSMTRYPGPGSIPA